MITETSVIALISVMGLWYLFYFAYRGYRLDLLRQRLFHIRGELILLYAEESIPEDLYRHFRATLNGYIRFAPELSLLSFLLFAITKDYRGAEPAHYTSLSDSIHRAQKCLSAEVRRKVGQLQGAMDRAVAEHAVMTSGIVWLLIVPLVAFYLVLNVKTRTTLQLRRTWRAHVGHEIEAAALAHGV